MGVLGTISGTVRLNIREAVAAYAALRAQNAKTVYAMRGAGEAFSKVGKVMTLGGIALGAVFVKAVKDAADFERRMDFFQAVTNSSKKEMDALGQSAMDMAAHSIYSAQEIVDGFVELGKAGVNAKGIMDGIGQAMVNLGAAGDISLTDSGQMITSTISQYDMAAKDATHVTDLLAGAANASIADISDLGYSLKYVGGVASAVGVSFDSTMTALSLLAKSGIRGSTAGTSLRQMLVSLGGATGPATEELQKLGIITKDGENKFFTASGKAKDLSKVFQILQDHTAKLSQKQRLAALRTIFNNRALASASILTRAGAKGFKQMYAEMGKVTAADVAHRRMDNLSGDLKKLRANIENTFIKQGTPVQDTLRKWVQSLTGLVKAFNNLSPQTQKTIANVLLMMAAFMLIVGPIMSFVGVIMKLWSFLTKLWAAISFVGEALGLTGEAAAGAGEGFALASNPIGWLVAAILALIAVLVICYNHFKSFRDWCNRLGSDFKKNVVDPIVNGAKRVWDGVQKLSHMSPGDIWAAVRDRAQQDVNAIVGFFRSLPGRVAALAGQLVTRVVTWLQQLPGRARSVISNFISNVISFFQRLPGRVGYFIGFMIGRVVSLFVQMGVRALAAVTNFISRTIQFFARLPGRIGYFIGFLAGRVVRGMINMGQRAATAVAHFVTRTIAFFRALPGRVASFVANLVTRVVAFFRQLPGRVGSIVASMVARVVSFFRSLPGRVASFVVNMVNRVQNLFHRLVNTAVQMGTGIYNGLMDGIRGLPGAVTGIIGNVISAFRNAIASAAASVRDFAAGMWNGFKAGLGIHSPSYIERAMWQITGVVDTETKKLAKRTMDVQKLSKQMAATQFGVGGASGRADVARLARDHAANLRRARELAAASSTSPSAMRGARDGRPSKQRLVDGELRLHPSGRAFIRGVAQDTYDENDYYDSTLEGMG